MALRLLGQACLTRSCGTRRGAAFHCRLLPLFVAVGQLQSNANMPPPHVWMAMNSLKERGHIDLSNRVVTLACFEKKEQARTTPPKLIFRGDGPFAQAHISPVVHCPLTNIMH